jgi:hypothetical protein
LLGLFFDTENADEIFLRNVGWLLTDYTALCPRRYVQNLVWRVQKMEPEEKVSCEWLVVFL